MNKKQKILTVVALVVFSVLGALHYLRATDYFFFPHVTRGIIVGFEITSPKDAIVSDVKMPWFMLGVIYTALFFVLQNKRES
jgi:hypothetical protein